MKGYVKLSDRVMVRPEEVASYWMPLGGYHDQVAFVTLKSGHVHASDCKNLEDVEKVLEAG